MRAHLGAFRLLWISLVISPSNGVSVCLRLCVSVHDSRVEKHADKGQKGNFTPLFLIFSPFVFFNPDYSAMVVELLQEGR